MTIEIQLNGAISVAFESTSEYGEGANVDVYAVFPSDLNLNLEALEQQFREVIRKWDHKHLALDVGPFKLSPRSFAKRLKEDLKDLGVLSVQLRRADGWQLEV